MLTTFPPRLSTHWVPAGRRVRQGGSDDPDGVNPIFHVTDWQPLPSPAQKP